MIKFNDHSCIPRSRVLKDVDIVAYKVVLLCNGQLFDDLFYSESFDDCYLFVKNFACQYYDDIIIEPIFNEQQ